MSAHIKPVNVSMYQTKYHFAELKHRLKTNEI